MGGLFSKPKVPVIEPPKPLPEPDNESELAKKRREAAMRVQQSGRAATQLSERESKPLGQ